MIQLMVVPNASNRKVGKGCGTTYRKVGDASKGEGTCPPGCKHLQTGECYAIQGIFTRMAQTRAGNRYDDIAMFDKNKKDDIRFLVGGDSFIHIPEHPRKWGLDVPYIRMITTYAHANPHRGFWMYCHDIRVFVADMPADIVWPSNIEVIASCDTDEDRAWAQSKGFRTARVIDTPEEKADGEVFCPYDRALWHGKTHDQIKVRCETCRLCFNDGPQDIAFLKH